MTMASSVVATCPEDKKRLRKGNSSLRSSSKNDSGMLLRTAAKNPLKCVTRYVSVCPLTATSSGRMFMPCPE
jgi:hypothetical protein